MSHIHLNLVQVIMLNKYKLLSLVNGGWGNWGDWEACSVSCGGGDQDRTRACDSPAPNFGGDECSGSASQTKRCKENPCPSKSNTLSLNII